MAEGSAIERWGCGNAAVALALLQDSMYQVYVYMYVPSTYVPVRARAGGWGEQPSGIGPARAYITGQPTAAHHTRGT